MKNKRQIDGNQCSTCPNVLVLYDTVSSGKRAKELCDRPGRNFGEEDGLRLSLHNLAELEIAPLAQAALAEGTWVTLLILAIDGGVTLSRSVKSWISRWGQVARSSGGALAAQLHGIVRVNQELSPAYVYLKHISNEEGLDFYSETVGPTADEPDSSIEAKHDRAQRTSLPQELVPTHRNPNLSLL